jgi:hypothetical protein
MDVIEHAPAGGELPGGGDPAIVWAGLTMFQRSALLATYRRKLARVYARQRTLDALRDRALVDDRWCLTTRGIALILWQLGCPLGDTDESEHTE